MNASAFCSTLQNISVNVPMFKVNIVPKRKGDAAKAFPEDRFITHPEYAPDEDDDEVAFCRLNSSGQPETNEDGDLMRTWCFEVGEVEYAGENQISLRLFNDMQESM